MKRTNKNIDIVVAEQSHITDLHSKIKQADIDELEACYGQSPEQVLTESLSISEEAYTVIVDGNPEMMFGIVKDEDNDDAAIVWMLSSAEVFSKVTVKRFIRETKKFVQQFHQKYLYLHNHVDERNLASLMWLRRVGFKLVSRQQSFGVMGLPFIQILSMRK